MPRAGWPKCSGRPSTVGASASRQALNQVRRKNHALVFAAVADNQE